jgi:hypothetical protein
MHQRTTLEVTGLLSLVLLASVMGLLLILEIPTVSASPNSELAYWPLDNDYQDYSGNNNHGTNHGTELVAGKWENAADFEENETDNINIPDDLGDAENGGWTVCAWVKLEQKASTHGDHMVVINVDDDNTSIEIRIKYTDDKAYFGYARVGPNPNAISSTLIDNTDAWYFITGVIRENRDIEIWINGVKEDTNTDHYLMNNPDDAHTIGAKGDLKPFDGLIDEVRIYDYGLNSDNISSLFENNELPSPPQEPEVTTNDATNIGYDNATLNGNLDNLGGAANLDVFFQYGTTQSYGDNTSKQNKTAAGSFSANISGLTVGTTYHFRAVAENTENTNQHWYGSDKAFKTLGYTWVVENQADWAGGSFDNTYTKDNILWLGHYDNFDSFDDNVWENQGSYHSGSEIILTNGTNQTNQLIFVENVDNREWIATARVEFTNDNSQFRLWFSANLDNPQSDPSSSEGHMVKIDMENENVYLYQRTGGSWNMLEGKNWDISEYDDAAPYTFKVHYIPESGEIKVYNNDLPLLYDNGIYPSYENKKFYFEGHTTGGANTIKILYAEISKNKGYWSRTYDFGEQVQPENLWMTGAIWDNWILYENNPIWNVGRDGEPVFIEWTDNNIWLYIADRNAAFYHMDVYIYTKENWPETYHDDIQNVVDPNYAFADVKRIGENLHAYTSASAQYWVGDNTTDWTQITSVGWEDPGFFFDAETGKWFAWPEVGTSPVGGGGVNVDLYVDDDENGKGDNYSKVADDVLGANVKKTGDVEVMKFGDRYLMFCDNLYAEAIDEQEEPGEPYTVGYYEADNLYGPWRHVMSGVIHPELTNFCDMGGPQDAVIRLVDNTFWHTGGAFSSQDDDVSVCAAKSGGPWEDGVQVCVSVDTDDDGLCDDDNTGWQDYTVTYSKKENRSSIFYVHPDNLDLSGLSAGYRFQVKLKLEMNSNAPEIDSFMLKTSEITNVAPEILDVYTPASVDVNTEIQIKIEVRDNDDLSDVDEVWLKIYENTLGQENDDNTRNHYTFKWVRAGADNWFEVGPDNTSPYDHLVVENCVAGSDSASVDNFVFAVKLAKIATPANWTVWAQAIDASAEQDNVEFTNEFEVNICFSLSFSPDSVTFKGWPGDSDIAAEENPITATIDANTNFDLREKISGHFTPENEDNIYLDNDGSAPYTLTLSTTYQILYADVGWGEAVEKYEYYFIDIPENVEGTYAITFYTELVAS